MRRIHTVAIAAAMLSFTAGVSSAYAQGAVVKDNHLEFSGKTYFRGGSEDVEIGSYGEKKVPLTKANYLEVQDRLPVPKMKIRQAVVVGIDFTKSSKADVLANISVSKVFKGSASTAYEDLKSGKLKLVKFIMENEDTRTAANTSPNVITNLINYGNDARICNQVFVVLEATLATAVTTATTLDAALDKGSLSISAKGGVSTKGSTVVTLSKGSTFAYGIVKLDWDATVKKNKTKITKCTDDQWSLN